MRRLVSERAWRRVDPDQAVCELVPGKVVIIERPKTPVRAATVALQSQVHYHQGQPGVYTPCGGRVSTPQALLFVERGLASQALQDTG